MEKEENGGALSQLVQPWLRTSFWLPNNKLDKEVMKTAMLVAHATFA